jgi:hypothetical protein
MRSKFVGAASVSKHFDETTGLMGRRFKEVWQNQNVTAEL